MLLRERSYAIKGEDTPFERLLNALFYSAVIYAVVVVSGWIAGLDKEDLGEFYGGEKSLGEYVLAAVLVAVLLPMLIAEAGVLWRGARELRHRVLRRLHISPAHSVTSGWNDFFGREGTMLLRVTLSDGRVVGGFYGPGSLAGYTEHQQDLLLSQRWELDEEDKWFVRPAPQSLGLWLSHESITSIEAYAHPEEQTAGTPAAIGPTVRVNIDG